MSDVVKNTGKSLHISQDVIARIITNTVSEIDGVCRIAPVMKSPRQIWLKQENFGNIRIGLVDDVLSVTIGVILDENAKAVQVAEEVQEKVKSAVQNMLGLTVAKVNVNVCGIETAAKE
ncbi:MAG: Asp23/Gls24 family envelope stress response protein [Ruminococcus sp.]|nr:Asp23/Gls24 family envelope stress response protein [Ruminococcus sp.]